MKKREWSLRDLWETLMKINMHIEGVSEGKEREKWTERVLEEIMVKNVSNLIKYINVNIQKTQQNPHKMNSKIHYNQTSQRKRQRALKTQTEGTLNIQKILNKIRFLI